MFRMRSFQLLPPVLLGLGGGSDGLLLGGLAVCHGIRVRAPPARCQRTEDGAAKIGERGSAQVVLSHTNVPFAV
jgi:hypothetical protein